jgi:lysozyme family protein
MKQNFNHCLEMLLKHEGGFVNHPRDPGGVTNLGVTLATYEQWMGRNVTVDEMKALTVKDVAPIYKKRYWAAVRGDDLPSGVDWSVFDWAVNSGPSRASRALQRIVGVTADGKIGPVTLRAAYDISAEKIIDEMYSARQRFYERLSTFDTFGKGWTRRNKETRQAALLMLD